MRKILVEYMCDECRLIFCIYVDISTTIKMDTILKDYSKQFIDEANLVYCCTEENGKFYCGPCSNARKEKSRINEDYVKGFNNGVEAVKKLYSTIASQRGTGIGCIKKLSRSCSCFFLHSGKFEA